MSTKAVVSNLQIHFETRHAEACKQLAKLVDNLNPALPMGAGFAAQFLQLRERVRVLQAAIDSLVQGNQPPPPIGALAGVKLPCSLVVNGQNIAVVFDGWLAPGIYQNVVLEFR